MPSKKRWLQNELTLAPAMLLVRLKENLLHTGCYGLHCCEITSDRSTGFLTQSLPSSASVDLINRAARNLSLTAWRHMRDLDTISCLGSRLDFDPRSFLSLPWRPIGSWARGRTPQTQADPCRAFLCLQALGFENPFTNRAAAPQGTQIRYLLLSDIRAPRLSQIAAEQADL
jgi:hypothetical protein